jgi:diaminohydroxyphosphoribosylaminopyrimidine deaminase/5-amino-6-(5-phosphoribosylamino)uracil reductase
MNSPDANSYVEAMQAACRQARQWLGSTSPNPPVGAVALDDEDNIIAMAAHHRAGESHAESKLIQFCAANSLLSKIKTLCVTLEPCNHIGRTPPCTQAILKAGIKHVVIGAYDSNPNVTGGGADYLGQNGIVVTAVVCSDECDQLIHAFAYKSRTGKPWITLKRAFDTNGSMIPAIGTKTFTSQQYLLLAHRLRKKADAIITGSGTILADNPLFTVRHTQDYPDKKRWLGIIDRRGRVPESYLDAAKERRLLPVIYNDIAAAILDLNDKNAQDILVEAGPTLSNAMIEEGHWTMQINLHKGNPDKIDWAFNSAGEIPFNKDKFNLENILPV